MNEFEVLCKMKQISRVSPLNLKIYFETGLSSTEPNKWDIVAILPNSFCIGGHEGSLFPRGRMIYERVIDCPTLYKYGSLTGRDSLDILYPEYDDTCQEREIGIDRLFHKTILEKWAGILCPSSNIFDSLAYINNFRAIIDFFLIKVIDNERKRIPSIEAENLIAYCLLEEGNIVIKVINYDGEEEEVKF